jgi:hypothetical protein
VKTRPRGQGGDRRSGRGKMLIRFRAGSEGTHSLCLRKAINTHLEIPRIQPEIKVNELRESLLAVVSSQHPFHSSRQQWGLHVRSEVTYF